MFFRLSLASLAANLAAPALAETQYGSEVPGLELVALDNLPAAPAGEDGGGGCGVVPSPETPAGRAAAAQGWKVTSEVPFGDLTAVSFVANVEPSTSGTCFLRDGNVGLLYATKSEEEMIGFVEPFGTGGLRVLSGDMLPTPIADLQRIGTNGVAVTPLAKEEPVCGGTAVVPNIYYMPIDKARVLLMSAGWEPVTGSAETQSSGMTGAIAAAGVIEVEDCSGTGLGFCAYRYSGPAGELGVTTAGEGGEDGGLPMVTYYGVDCR
jgi:hypothetical protein